MRPSIFPRDHGAFGHPCVGLIRLKHVPSHDCEVWLVVALRDSELRLRLLHVHARVLQLRLLFQGQTLQVRGSRYQHPFLRVDQRANRRVGRPIKQDVQPGAGEIGLLLEFDQVVVQP